MCASELNAKSQWPKWALNKPDRNSRSWSAQYGERHQLVRLVDFPNGIAAPKKVRIYSRRDHFVLQWWDPRAKATLSLRVEGDLVTAIAQARAVEDRLMTLRSSGQPRNRRVSHADLVTRFLSDLGRRADAQEIDPATARRYNTALQHYLQFCAQLSIAKGFPNASCVNRDFRLAFGAFLADRVVSGNGRNSKSQRPMMGHAFVMDTVRAMFEWAADPDRGGQLPEGFRNPFRRSGASRSILKGDPLAEPDITLPMGLSLLKACDAFQLRLFAPMLLFGLRAAEPCFLFAAYVADGWFQVPCNVDLNVKTKGRLSKRFPLLESLAPLWNILVPATPSGLLYVRRSVAAGIEKPPFLGCSASELVVEYRRRCAQCEDRSAERRQKIRDGVFRDAGGLTYDQLEGEFKQLTRRMNWPVTATVKDLRHLFATTMNNAGMPEGFRRYLLGQAPGRAAIVAYTHLNELQKHYAAAVQSEWSPLVEVINNQVTALAGTRP
jgi:hypothetical protein